MSAQNRQRFYVHNCGDVQQPEDRGILLKDILETGCVDRDKAYCTQVAYEEVSEPLNITSDGKSQTLKAQYGKNSVANFCCYTSTYGASGVAQPIRVGDYPNSRGETDCGQAMRIYSIDGKSTNLIANAGGMGGHTGLYAVPSSKTSPKVYEVKNGTITINGGQYEIKLKDGYYIIRKLTVTECCRLQTLPDGYCRAVSNTQAYRGLGNGWTAEVIIHILSSALKDVSKDEEIVVLSMYDGIGTGRYCLDKMGFKNVTYYAYEIDKYAKKIAMSNYPDIIQCGDAFQLRDDSWSIETAGNTNNT